MRKTRYETKNGGAVEVIGAFSTEHAARLAHLTKRQVEYWHRSDVYSPSLATGLLRQPFGRIYSFRDVVALRTLALLRRDVSLQQLRKLGQWLRQNYDTPWASLEFAVDAGQVFFRDPDHGVWISAKPLGQAVMSYRIETIAAEMETRLAKLRQRPTADFGRIVRHRYVAQNQYVVAGTRIPTEIIWDYHVAGYSTDDILREYTELTSADVEAAIVFESERLAG
jgi:uncharacterized protein (DUF433 family)